MRSKNTQQTNATSQTTGGKHRPGQTEREDVLADGDVSGCARRTPLHAAAFAEDVAGLQLVLRHGAEINTVDKSGRSALMVAADKGHSGTVGECQTCAAVAVVGI